VKKIRQDRVGEQHASKNYLPPPKINEEKRMKDILKQIDIAVGQAEEARDALDEVIDVLQEAKSKIESLQSDLSGMDDALIAAEKKIGELENN
jgi:predicted  nucleic acid-binding Zn-ribbon protein